MKAAELKDDDISVHQITVIHIVISIDDHEAKQSKLGLLVFTVEFENLDCMIAALQLR